MSDTQSQEHHEWDDLVDRHLFGELNELEMQRLAEMLDSDASLRKDFVERAAWEIELSEVIRTGGSDERNKFDSEAAASQILGSLERGQSWSIRMLSTMLAIAAAAILMLSVLLVTSRNGVVQADRIEPESVKVDSIAQITGLSGAMIWTGDRGQILREITVGTELAGGTIEGLSPDSWFELQFKDGSEVTISGASMLTFSDAGQKRLRLREGRMSADVSPQPAGSPMLINTHTATLTVLGTSFDVEADLPATAVNVREGTVRVTRTSDGKEILVPANHRVVAAADQALERQQIAEVVRTWESRIDQGPDETYGKWIAASDSRPALLKAVAFVPKEAPNLILYLLGIGVRSEEGAPVQVNSDSYFQIRGEIDIETEVYFGIQVAYADGNFAGKFLARCDVQRDSSGDFLAKAKLSEFRLDPSVVAYKDKLASSPEDLFITGVWSFTHSMSPSGLRISTVELTNTPDDFAGSQ